MTSATEDSNLSVSMMIANDDGISDGHFNNVHM
jgi:hypothetical protein